MSRSQILIVIIAIAVATGIFFLPKVIVDPKKEAGSAKSEATAALPEGHSADDGHDHGAEAAPEAHAAATPDQLMTLATARSKYNKTTDPQLRNRLATELADAYAAALKYDSAGYYFEIAAKARPGEKSYKKAADAYYNAFTFAATQERAGQLGEKARSMYEQVLKNNPSDLDAKTNVAMTYVSTTNPMQGITLLREVIAANPNHEKALFNLGILSVQSGQYDKAAERFQKLVEVNPKHVEGTFYLAVSLAETKQNEEAKRLFNKVKTMSSDPALAASVDEALAKLQ